MARQYKDYDTQQDIGNAAANALREHLFRNHDTMTLDEASAMMRVVSDAVGSELRTIESEHFADALAYNRENANAN